LFVDEEMAQRGVEKGTFPPGLKRMSPEPKQRLVILIIGVIQGSLIEDESPVCFLLRSVRMPPIL
jgi:hypothetical protein